MAKIDDINKRLEASVETAEDLKNTIENVAKNNDVEVVKGTDTPKSVVEKMGQQLGNIDSISELNLTYGEESPTYDTTDGMTVRATGQLKYGTDKTTTFDTEFNLPLVPADDTITIDVDEQNKKFTIKSKKSEGAPAFVFATKQDFLDWIDGKITTDINGKTIADLQIGSSVYIREAETPDYWCSSKSTPLTISDFTELETDFNPDDYLAKNNTTEYTPTGDYNPATKKYADSKVAKYTEKGKTVYGTEEGEQKNYSISTEPTANSIAQRDESGKLTTATPTTDNDATNKKYVDDSNDITSLDLSYGEEMVIYDTTDGITINGNARKANADGSTKDFAVEMNIPIVAGDGINIDAKNNNKQIEIKSVTTLVGETAPTTSTVGYIGQLYLNTTDNSTYQCKAISDGSYTWKLVNEDKFVKSTRNASGAFDVVYARGKGSSQEDYFKGMTTSDIKGTLMLRESGSYGNTFIGTPIPSADGRYIANLDYLKKYEQCRTGTSDPTSTTVAYYVGQLYLNTTENTLFKCDSINGSTYTWTTVCENGGKAVILSAPPTAMNGTITEEQLATLQANDNNYIFLNNEIYRLDDKQLTEGFLIYSHTGQDNSKMIFIKEISITISTLAWTLTKFQPQEVLEFDENPIKNSNNPVKSKGIQQAFVKQGVADINDCSTYDELYNVLASSSNGTGIGNIGISANTSIKTLLPALPFNSNYVNCFAKIVAGVDNSYYVIEICTIDLYDNAQTIPTYRMQIGKNFVDNTATYRVSKWYNPAGKYETQKGIVTWSAERSHTQTITFPEAFSSVPTVVCTAIGVDTVHTSNICGLAEVTATGFTVAVYGVGSNDKSIGVHWIAIGE